MRLSLLTLLTCCLCAGSALAQPTDGVGGRYYPLSQRSPAGVPGYWAGAYGRTSPQYLQPIRVDLPSKGTVSLFQGQKEITASDSQAMFAVGVGYTYRLKITDLPEHPGQTLYPSIEMIDRLHAPPGKVLQFPVPIQFTAEEIDAALSGKMVVKVMYLEQPQRAVPRTMPRLRQTDRIPNHRNLLAEADERGRPMAIIRIGGRAANVRGANTGFYGQAGPAQLIRLQKDSGNK